MQLLKWSQKFQAEQANIAGDRLSKDFGRDWRGLVRNDTRRGWRRRRYGYADHLIGPEKMCRGDTRACGTDVERLGQFDELNAGRIDATKKNRYLEANTRGLAALLHAFTLPVDLKFQTSPMVPAN